MSHRANLSIRVAYIFGSYLRAALAVLLGAAAIAGFATIYIWHPFGQFRDAAGNEWTCARATLGRTGWRDDSLCFRTPPPTPAPNGQAERP
jgi:hypothetical protein